MFAIIIVLAIVSAMVEYKLVNSCKPLFNLMSKESVCFAGKTIDTRLLPLIFSLMLSMLLGTIFGAAGLMVFVAGILSTVAMQPVYSMMRKGTWQSASANFAAKKADVNKTIEHHKNAIVGAWAGLVRIIKVIVAIVMVPVAIITAILNFVGDPKGTMKKAFSNK